MLDEQVDAVLDVPRGMLHSTARLLYMS